MKNAHRNITYSALGYILPLIISLATIPLMIKYMGVDIYGLYIICVSLIGFMVFVDLGVGQAIIKYVSQYEITGETQKVKPVLDIALLLYISLGVLISGLIFIFADKLGGLISGKNPQNAVLAAQALSITALAFCISYINQFFLNIFRAYHRFDIPAVIHNSANAANIITASVLLLLKHGIIAILWGHVLIQVIALSSSFIYSKKVLPKGIELGFSFDKTIFHEMIAFSFYTFISNLLGSITSRLDKFIIGAILGTEAVTYYQIPYTIVQMANGIVQSLGQITFPRFSELFSLDEKDLLLELYKRSVIVMFLISMAINVMLMSVGGLFLEMWISADFSSKSTLTLQIIALYFFFQSSIVVPYWAIQGSGNAKITAFCSTLGTIIYMAGIYFLTQHYAYNGAAASLFFLLTPLPIFYMWIQNNIGHKFIEYLAVAAFVGSLGVLIIILLDKLNILISNGYLVIVIDGIIVSSLTVVFLAYIFRDKLNLRFK